MSSLADETLVPGNKVNTAISPEDARSLLEALPGWILTRDEGVDKLVREYGFSDYLTLIALTGKIGNMAEQVNHHPVLLTEWGKLTVSWWTHTLNGLHRNDFIMAARCDRAAMLVSAP